MPKPDVPGGPQISEQVHFVKTGDGHPIALQHYSPAEKTARLPVLMVHGLGANRHNFDLFGDDDALPRQLARKGYECYVIELRGIGLSRAPRGQRRAQGVDEYLRYDLPAAVEHVLKAQDQEKLHWVGHSMGAILGYIYGSSFGHQIHSLLAAAGPVPAAVPLPGVGMLKPLRHMIAGKQLQNIELPNRLGLKALKRMPKLVRLAYDKVLFYADNMPDDWLLKFADSGLENIPLSVLRRLGDWAVPSSRFGGEVERALGSLYVPTLFLAAKYDPLCPPDVVEHARRLMPEGYAKTHIISSDYGSVDFGHGDLLASPPAKRWVFPLVMEFIDAQEAARVGQALRPPRD
ncbi:MAG: alpha/beta fold hydrolase [Deltaproteobacteria bacterium]|nr:alpha/beta fold hydrolase [Deltaproteobacteria bacterium]